MIFSTRGVRHLPFAIAIVMTLSLSTQAFASHYYLVDIPNDFSEADRELFARFGIDDTLDLLRWLDTPEQRNALRGMSGLSTDQITSLTLYCDLLQVEGVGPTAAHLLIASGITGSANLASTEPASLLADVQTVNMVESITATTPTDGHIEAWIAAAAEVPIQVIY